MIAVALTIRALEPLLLSKPFAGEENSAISNDYIPGSALRGASIAAYLRQNNQKNFDLMQDENIKCIFFSNTCQFLNAYPTHPETGERSLPIPLSWVVKKNQEFEQHQNIYDMALQKPQTDESLKKPNGSYFSRRRDEIYLITTEKIPIPHNTSQDANRKSAGTSTVFRYVAINSGEEFSSAVLCEREEDAELIEKTYSSGTFLLGGSHRAGYGKVQVEAQIKNDWKEFTPNEENEEDSLTITLLSDTIIRNLDGQTGTDFDQALSKYLGMDTLATHSEAFWQLNIVGGYNRKWGLPLPQDYALAAGSTFVYLKEQFKAQLDEKKFNRSIGERTIEGFGRLAVNLSTRAEFPAEKTVRPVAADMDMPETILLTSESLTLADVLNGNRLKNLLNEKLPSIVMKWADKVHGGCPSKTQLSRLRTVVARSAIAPDLQGITFHLEHLTDDSKGQFLDCYVGNISLFDWIKKQAKGQNVKVLFDLKSEDLPKTASRETVISDEISNHYTALLLDNMLRVMAKGKE